MNDARPFAYVGKNIECVFAMIELKSKQIILNMGWMCGSGLTRANVPQTSLVIDSGATIHFFSNEELLQSIKATKAMKIHCGGSTFDRAMIGHIRNELKHLPLPRGKICIIKDRIANLLLMGKLVKEGYRVTMYSDGENAINVYNDDVSYIKFVCVQDGLYCINLDSSGEHINFLTTVADEKIHFFDLDNKKAALARYIQECLCLPSDVDLADAINNGGIRECGIDRRHIKLPTSSMAPPKLPWKERLHRGRTRCPVTVV